MFIRSFEGFPPDSREGLFFYRLGQLDTTTVYPLVLEVLKRYGGANSEQNGNGFC